MKQYLRALETPDFTTEGAILIKKIACTCYFGVVVSPYKSYYN
jgi:hypothetical protein